MFLSRAHHRSEESAKEKLRATSQGSLQGGPSLESVPLAHICGRVGIIPPCSKRRTIVGPSASSGSTSGTRSVPSIAESGVPPNRTRKGHSYLHGQRYLVGVISINSLLCVLRQ
jgi:hypothetical protein